MGVYTVTGDTAVRVRSGLHLHAREKQLLFAHGTTRVARPVVWPVLDCTPHFENAYVDPGDGLFGPGPYLKVPNGADDADFLSVNRVFCPWGYPPRRLHIGRRTRGGLHVVEVVREGNDWMWLLTLDIVLSSLGWRAR